MCLFAVVYVTQDKIRAGVSIADSWNSGGCA